MTNQHTWPREAFQLLFSCFGCPKMIHRHTVQRVCVRKLRLCLENTVLKMILKYLTISFASLFHQKLCDVEKAFGSSQVERSVPNFTTRIHIGSKLQ